jgi:hypothetical protein
VATWLSRFSLFLAFCQGGFKLDLTAHQGTGTKRITGFWQSRVYRLGPTSLQGGDEGPVSHFSVPKWWQVF